MTSRWPGKRILLGAAVLVAASAQVAAAAGPTPMTTPDVRSRWDESALFIAGDLPDDATGTVTFAVDDDAVCTGEVSGGAAVCSSGPTPREVGTYAVSAVYSGDGDHGGATTSLQWSVTKAVRQVRLHTPDRVVVGRRALLRARLVTVVHCSLYAGCRPGHDEGVLVWRVVRVGGDVRFRHRSVVQDGEARFRTPRLPRRGTYVIAALYDGGRHYVGADNTARLRVTRR